MRQWAYSKYIDPYINLIKSNKVVHCVEQEQMIDNIVVPVLKRKDVYIDNDKIEKGLSLQKYFPYKLLEWEVFLFALIAGVFLKDGDIYFDDIRILVGRGAGKNGFISFLIFYFLSEYHGIQGYNIDLLANSEKQVQTSFMDVYNVITDNHDPANNVALEQHYGATKELITGKKTKSVLRFNTSSKRGKDSKRTGCVIFDEKHEYMDSENINTLKSGLGKVWHARVITITTDGHVRGGVLDKEKDQNRDILKEYNPDNRTLVFWCKIEKEEEWKDIDMLVKSIPSLTSNTENFKSLRSTIKKEIADMPYNMDYLPEFMAKRCNFPIGNKDVEVASWDDICAANIPIDRDLINLLCCGGIDYAKTNDFVACCLIFKADGFYYLLHHTFVCTRSRDLPGIKAPLRDWANKGDLTFVDEVEIPADLVAEWFAQCGYTAEIIGMDNYRYSLMRNALGKVGYDAPDRKNIKLIRPSDIMRIAPVINSVFVNHKIAWGDSPIMKWYTNNTKKVIKGAGNMWYDKIEPIYRKTDGFMALVNAMVVSELLPEYSPMEVPDLKMLAW